MHSYCIQSSERMSGRGPKWLKRWNTLGNNNWQQHIVTISCSDKSPYVYWRIFVQICLCNRILSLQQVTQNQTRLWEFVWLAVAKIVLWRQDFHKNSPIRTKPFVTAKCHPTCCLNDHLYTRLICCHNKLQWHITSCVTNLYRLL